MSNEQRYCLATVTTENYFQWTMTMLHSFVSSNPWFGGDIVVICQDLPSEMTAGLNLFGHVNLVEPSADLTGRLIEFGNALPAFKDKTARFYSLEIFRMSGYEKLLFLDSDMIVVKSVEELFNLPGSFYASAELCWYKGKGRDAANFKAGYQATENHADFLRNPFNTGFMVLGDSVINENHYPELLKLIDPERWGNDNLSYTDERIINQYFRNRAMLLDTRYNFRARAARMIREKENISIDDAKIIHYYSKYKPWNFTEVLDSSQNNLTWLRAYEMWYERYISFLKFYHLQKKLIAFKKPTNRNDE
ncbi:MAG: glycosyltransferase family 8 protein [Bacteroidales bacterium]